MRGLTPVDAHRLDGYLQAIARLKDDGTSFCCVHLGTGELAGKAAEVERLFGFERGSVRLASERPALTAENLPQSLERWCLDRIRPMDDLQVDRRLVSGLADELADLFQQAPAWHSLACSDARVDVSARMGVIWTIYVVGLEVGWCAIHCRWDD